MTWFKDGWSLDPKLAKTLSPPPFYMAERKLERGLTLPCPVNIKQHQAVFSNVWYFCETDI